MEGAFLGADAGWLPEMEMKASQQQDGVNRGPASGHTNLDRAKLVGLPRHYGYGSSMGVWVLDYVAYWGGRPWLRASLQDGLPLPRLRGRRHAFER